jgi:hypothetical protein
MEHQRVRRSRIEWSPSTVHPEWMIASPTLAALRALLGRARSGQASLAAPATSVPPGGGGMDRLSVRLADMPGLAEVGGVAAVVADGGEAVAVARVGRTSFVGFRLDGQQLQEIAVALDESAGRLLIATPATYSASPRS